jgi:predicted DNA-binding transcriptional regulator AlpA
LTSCYAVCRVHEWEVTDRDGNKGEDVKDGNVETLKEDRIISKSECRKVLGGVSDSTIWRLEHQGDFPKRVRVAPGTAGWRMSEVQQWIAKLGREESEKGGNEQK